MGEQSIPKQRRSKGRKQYSENERKRAVARVVKSLVLSVERAAKDEIIGTMRPRLWFRR